MPLPERLKAAREARGWSVEYVAEQLRLPARLVALAEAGDLNALGAPIYRRGYLRSMARLLGVADDELQADAEAIVEEPQLVATGVTPRSEYMIERYLRPATYIALTALIALPVVWWAASGKLGEELAAARSFDLQPPPIAALHLDHAGLPAAGSPGRPQPLLPDQPAAPPPLVRASMMALPPAPDVVAEPDAAAAVEPGSAAIGTGSREAVLELGADSWVEVTAADGSRLHQALLGPGRWSFRTDGELSFKIGNSRAARLLADGEEVDLATGRSANDVARVQVFGRDG